MAESTFTIKPLKLEDVAEVAQISVDAFDDVDRHTEMKKQAEEKPYDMKQYALDSTPSLLANPRCVMLKAVDNETGAIMGHTAWGFRGFKAADMPVVEGRVQLPDDPEPTPEEKAKADAEEKARAEEAKKPKEYNPKTNDRIHALTDADMKRWMDDVMPPGTRAMYLVGLSVAPRFQRRGVGKALLKWGTDTCDREGVFAWVHSSEPAWRMYEKCGFKVMRELDVDLDEYSHGPPPGEGPDAIWGHYVFRYMQYFPGGER